MGQYEILGFLEQNEGWHSTRAIAKHFDKSTSVIALSLRKLHKWGLVEMVLKPKNKYFYKSKGIYTRSPLR